MDGDAAYARLTGAGLEAGRARALVDVLRRVHAIGETSEVDFAHLADAGFRHVDVCIMRELLVAALARRGGSDAPIATLLAAFAREAGARPDGAASVPPPEALGSTAERPEQERTEMAATPPVCDFGWTAPEFRLPATDGRVLTLAGVAGPRGTLVAFICNHCPYVRSVIDRIVRDARELADLGIGTAAICSNDATTHPADSFDNMARFAAENGFAFPYLHDEDQSVARAWGAACTPDFFGLNAERRLQYRGRLDASGTRAVPGARRDLYEAMREVAETGAGPRAQTPSMGCSIKWRAEA